MCLLLAMCTTPSRVAAQQEQSFKEFIQRPEHRALLEQHQQEEVSAVLQLREQMQELQLQQEVRQCLKGHSRAYCVSGIAITVDTTACEKSADTASLTFSCRCRTWTLQTRSCWPLC